MKRKVIGTLTAAGVLCGLLPLGCVDVFGISSDRELDTEYPSAGYLGCEPGDCGHCITEVHRCLCQQGTDCSQTVTPEDVADKGGIGGESGDSSAAGGGGNAGDNALDSGGASTSGSGGSEPLASGGSGGTGASGGEPALCDDPEAVDVCLSCACGACAPSVQACEMQAGCLELLECAQRTGCDPLAESGNTRCDHPQSCAEEIALRGGPVGASYQALIVLAGCVDPECQSCEGLSPVHALMGASAALAPARPLPLP